MLDVDLGRWLWHLGAERAADHQGRPLGTCSPASAARPEAAGGYDLYTVQGWDYPALCETYLSAAQIVRREHVPAIVHVTELTQPQGHSTSGSHERYKSAERLAWEEEFDCLQKMRAVDAGAGDRHRHRGGCAGKGGRPPRPRGAASAPGMRIAGPVEEERSFVLAVTEDLARTASRPEQRAEVEAVRQELEEDRWRRSAATSWRRSTTLSEPPPETTCPPRAAWSHGSASRTA